MGRERLRPPPGCREPVAIPRVCAVERGHYPTAVGVTLTQDFVPM